MVFSLSISRHSCDLACCQNATPPALHPVFGTLSPQWSSPTSSAAICSLRAVTPKPDRPHCPSIVSVSSWWISPPLHLTCVYTVTHYEMRKLIHWYKMFNIAQWISFFFKIYLFFYWLIDWLLCWVFVSVWGLSLVVASRGSLFIAVHGPLTIVASLVAEHRLQTRRLSSCGSRA